MQSEIRITKVSVFVNPYTEMDEEEAEKAKIRPPTEEEEAEKVRGLASVLDRVFGGDSVG